VQGPVQKMFIRSSHHPLLRLSQLLAIGTLASSARGGMPLPPVRYDNFQVSAWW
jgi:hypothetical protein